jgi:UDP-N-acetylglucosamine acyltransferase
VVLGAENILREHVTIHRSMMAEQETRIGDRNFLMTGCHLAHDVVVENDCTLANAALVAGHVHIASFCFLGGNCALHQFIRVGRGAIVKGVVGVSVDIPPFCVVAEMNALAGLNIIGLRRQGFTPEQRNALKRAFSLIFRSGKNLTQSIEEAQNQPWEGPAALLVEFVATRGKRGIATLNRQISSEHS